MKIKVVGLILINIVHRVAISVLMLSGLDNDS